ncbi:MAG: hydroxypyruvate isomerase [Acidobacteria bacterium]|nr:MAG: hydroxypyruvate isomerase [Acidobacteriota bacterium]
MNRRHFTRSIAGAALSTALPGTTLSAANSAQVAPPFKFSVMLWTVFPDLPFEQRLEKVAEAGYPSVELVKEFEKWSDENFRRFNAKKRALGITFDATAGVWKGIADPAAREAFLSDLNKMLITADKLECPAIIVLSGDRVPGLSHDQQHQSCIETLKRGADVAARRNVTLLLENIDPEENPKYYLTSVAEGFEIVRAVNHPRVKFLYDFYHEQIAEGNLIGKLEKNIDEVGLIHVADVPGRHEPGTGEINYSNIYRKLAELNYSRYVAMEFMPSGEPVATLRAARETAMRSAAK